MKPNTLYATALALSALTSACSHEVRLDTTETEPAPPAELSAIAIDVHNATAIAATADDLFWIGDGRLTSIARYGGESPEVIATNLDHRRLAIGGGWIFIGSWLTQIERVSANGDVFPTAFDHWAFDMKVHDHSLYFTDGTGVFVQPGFAGEPQHLFDFDNGLSHHAGPHSIAVNATAALWSSSTGSGGLFVTDRDTQEKITLDEDVMTHQLGMDDTYGYWVANGHIHRARLDGTDEPIVMIAPPPGEQIFLLAVIDDAIFWAEGVEERSDATLRSARL